MQGENEQQLEPDDQPASSMSWRGILNGALRTFFLWAVVIGVFTWRSSPGVVCMTPIGWLLSVWVGTLYLSYTRSQPDRWVKEALLAGALFGLLQGLLFVVLTQVLAPLTPSERANMAGIGIVITGLGLFACAGLAALVVMLRRQRLVRT